MIRSLKFTRLIALLTLLAWANVQAMACCLVTPDFGAAQHGVHESSSQETTKVFPMAADHSCCPGESAPEEESPGAGHQATAEEPQAAAANDECEMGTHGSTGLCCAPAEAASEAVTFLSTFSFTPSVLGTLPLPAYPEKVSGAPRPPGSPWITASAPPRYLTLERFLI